MLQILVALGHIIRARLLTRAGLIRTLKRIDTRCWYARDVEFVYRIRYAWR